MEHSEEQEDRVMHSALAIYISLCISASCPSVYCVDSCVSCFLSRFLAESTGKVNKQTKQT